MARLPDHARRGHNVVVECVELRILGPVELVGEDGTVAVPAKVKRLLVALALEQGRACRVETLIDAVWGDEPPPSAAKLLQGYVSQARRVLPPPAAIETREGAYVLEAPDEFLDAVRFRRLAEQAADAARAGNSALARALAEQALGLWRGDALGELVGDEAVRREAARLDELRWTVEEQRVSAEIDLGRHEQAVGSLAALVDLAPLREHLHELLMLALYRAGRQSDALDHFTSVRRRFQDELGLDPGPALRDLQSRILRQDPDLDLSPQTLRSATALPVAPNPLIGRAAGLASLHDLLIQRAARLIVLTGAGGSGKTRLALEAARNAAETFANGAAVVDATSLVDPAQVAPAIAHSLGLADPAATDPVGALAAALSTQERLILLDNVEQVRAAGSVLVEILARAPRVVFLVTSRVVLHVSGERVFAVPPLDEEAAIELFVQRAEALAPGFRIDPTNEDDLRAICRRVDGLPLAIELAAATIRTLTPQALHDRLSSRLTVLVGGPRDLPARQQTLRETVTWSTDLLATREREVFAALSVFVGGAPLSAAETVCSAELDTLGTLVDHHLIRRSDVGGGEPRFSMLETIRDFALEVRAGDPEREAQLRRNHATWCLELAEQAAPELSGERQSDWFAVLEMESDNLRAALAYFEEAGAREELLRLTVALFRFWYVRGHLLFARQRLERTLALTDGQPLELRRRGVTAVAAIALLQGDYAAALDFARRALEMARATGEDRLLANALSNLGAIALAAGASDEARDALEQAVAIARAVGDQRVLALALNNLGDVELTESRYAEARPLFAESLALLRAQGDSSNIARSLFNCGAVDLMLEELDGAARCFVEGASLSDEAGDREDFAWCLQGLAGLAAARGDADAAGRLLGAAQAQLEAMGAAFKPFERRLHEVTLERTRDLCGEAELVRLAKEGASLSRPALIDLIERAEGAE